MHSNLGPLTPKGESLVCPIHSMQTRGAASFAWGNMHWCCQTVPLMRLRPHRAGGSPAEPAALRRDVDQAQNAGNPLTATHDMVRARSSPVCLSRESSAWPNQHPTEPTTRHAESAMMETRHHDNNCAESVGPRAQPRHSWQTTPKTKSWGLEQNGNGKG